MDATDLEKLSDILARADRVIPLIDAHNGDNDPLAISMRHDVDDRGWRSVREMARWEHARGYRSTYYFLHTAPYWGPGMSEGLHEIADYGHEIGYHNNALAESLRQGVDPHEMLLTTLAELREWSGQPIFGTAAHGDVDCNYGTFANYQVFEEERHIPYVVEKFKSPEELGFEPHPMADYGLTYQGDWAKRERYLTDSGGNWEKYTYHKDVLKLSEVWRDFPYDRQLSILQHPDHWAPELFA